MYARYYILKCIEVYLNCIKKSQSFETKPATCMNYCDIINDTFTINYLCYTLKGFEF